MTSPKTLCEASDIEEMSDGEITRLYELRVGKTRKDIPGDGIDKALRLPSFLQLI
jgi:hypothetical protein